MMMMTVTDGTLMRKIVRNEMMMVEPNFGKIKPLDIELKAAAT